MTGGTGEIGSVIADKLRQVGNMLKLLVRDPRDASRLTSAGWSTVIGDLADEQSLAKAFRGCDQVVISSGAGPEMVELQRNAIIAAKAARVSKIVNLSSRGADSKSPVELLRYHGRIEDIIHHEKLNFVILRPTFMFQNITKDIGQSLRSGKLTAPLGEARIAMLDAEDVGSVVDVACKSEAYDGKTLHLTGSQALSHRNVADAITRVFQKRVDYISCTPAEFVDELSRKGLSRDMVRITVDLYADWAQGNASAIQDTVAWVLKRQPRKLTEFLTKDREETPPLAG